MSETFVRSEHVDVSPDAPEIVTAAKWWADQLRGPAVQDNGDKFMSGFATAASMMCKPLAPEVIAKFEAELRTRLAAKYNELKCWYPSNPNWASAMRVIHVDYNPCGPLLDAAEAVGVDMPSLRFPIKTCVWVNPGRVEVARGYGAARRVVYVADSAEEPS
jgi:hypothetical protein